MAASPIQRYKGDLAWEETGWEWIKTASLQSPIQSPQALLPAVCRQERLWSTGILLPQDFCGKTMQAVAWQPIKNFNFFRILQSLSWRPTAGQGAWGLWVRDWSTYGPIENRRDVLLRSSMIWVLCQGFRLLQFEIVRKRFNILRSRCCARAMKLIALLHPFWNHWWSLQSDWLSTVRFIPKLHHFLL